MVAKKAIGTKVIWQMSPQLIINITNTLLVKISILWKQLLATTKIPIRMNLLSILTKANQLCNKLYLSRFLLLLSNNNIK